MKQTLITPPIYYPVTLDQVKDHLRITHSNDEPYLQALIAAATDKAEQYIRRRLITQTWKIFLNDWPNGDEIILPFGQLQSVTHVKYKDTDGTQSTWNSSTEYIVDTSTDPGRIVLAYGKEYPTTTLYPSNPIEIQFVCGYGAHTPLAITDATNATPIVLTTAAHGYSANDTIYVYGVGGNTAADGLWRITVPLTTTIGLVGSTGNAAYTSGGKCILQDVPRNIVNAIMLMISDMYENRETIIAGAVIHNLKTAENLLYPYRIWRGA